MLVPGQLVQAWTREMLDVDGSCVMWWRVKATISVPHYTVITLTETSHGGDFTFTTAAPGHVTSVTCHVSRVTL